MTASYAAGRALRRFADAGESAFDAVILATGYQAGLEKLFPKSALPLDRNGMPVEVIGKGELAAVYLVWFDRCSRAGC